MIVSQRALPAGGEGEHGTCNWNGFPRNLKQAHLSDPPMVPGEFWPTFSGSRDDCCNVVLIKSLPGTSTGVSLLIWLNVPDTPLP